MTARWMRFLRAIVALLAFFAVQPASAAPRVVDPIVLVAQTAPQPSLVITKERARIRASKRTRVRVDHVRERGLDRRPIETRTAGFYLKRVARVMMLMAAGIGPAPPPPPLPEPQKVEMVAEDANGNEED